jgi:hypothetical protein
MLSRTVDGSQNGLPSLRYFRFPHAQPLCLALLDPIDRILKGRGSPFRRACNACSPASSSLLLPPSSVGEEQLRL